MDASLEGNLETSFITAPKLGLEARYGGVVLAQKPGESLKQAEQYEQFSRPTTLGSAGQIQAEQYLAGLLLNPDGSLKFGDSSREPITSTQAATDVLNSHPELLNEQDTQSRIEDNLARHKTLNIVQTDQSPISPISKLVETLHAELNPIPTAIFSNTPSAEIAKAVLEGMKTSNVKQEKITIQFRSTIDYLHSAQYFFHTGKFTKATPENFANSVADITTRENHNVNEVFPLLFGMISSQNETQKAEILRNLRENKTFISSITNDYETYTRDLSPTMKSRVTTDLNRIGLFPIIVEEQYKRAREQIKRVVTSTN